MEKITATEEHRMMNRHNEMMERNPKSHKLRSAWVRELKVISEVRDASKLDLASEDLQKEAQNPKFMKNDDEITATKEHRIMSRHDDMLERNPKSQKLKSA